MSDSEAPDDLPPRVVAEIAHHDAYAALIRAFRARADELKIAVTGAAVHEVCGLPSYYFSKILSPSPTPAKRFGSVSLGPILAALALKIVLVEDRAALDQYTSRIPKRRQEFAHGGGFTVSLSRQFMRKIGKTGGLRRAELARQRSAAASRAAKIRWANGNGHKRNGRTK
jgi:hypothetical protein